MVFVDLKPAPNNKDIFQIEHLQQYKVTFEPPKQKGTLHNVPTVNDTGTQGITVSTHQDASNAPVPI
jgi:hypothetical protein